jgi:hypothetical protein
MKNKFETEVNDDGIVDATNFEKIDKVELDPLERQEREKAKVHAKPAPKGEFIVTTTLKVDNKTFNRGDVYEGKLYADMVQSKVVIPKSEWAGR